MLFGVRSERRSARQVFEEIRNGGVKVRSLFTLVRRNAPHVPRSGDEHLACSRCGRQKLMSRNLVAFFVRQCDKAIERVRLH
jgi:hypothetical protein